MDIIDGHVHIGTWPRWDLSLSVRGLDRVMKEYRYAGAVVIPSLVDRDDPVGMNVALQKQVEGRKDLFFFPWVHVRDTTEDDRSLLGYLEANRASIHGLKFHASISQMGLADKRLRRILEHADRERLPLLYHCGRHPISSAAPIKQLAPTYPNVKFIVAHLGGNAFDIVVDTMSLFRGAVPPNVYLDTSTARHPTLLRRAVDAYGEDRLLFGTDLPFTEMNMNWACLEFAGVLGNEAIMGGNLRRLLKT